MRVLVELEQLKEEGLFRGITDIIDAGAHQGMYADAVLQLIPGATIHCFEPASVAHAFLSARFRGNARVKCHEQALGAINGKVTFHLSGFDQANSVKAMTSLHAEAWDGSQRVGQQEVAMIRLETYLRELPADARVFLKIDVQGAEKDVLSGCGLEIGKIQVIAVELSLVSLYEGSALAPEMVQYLDASGFDLYGVMGRITAPGRVNPVQLDCVFLRKGL